MTNQLLDAALCYAANGWAVFPCRPRGKTPLTKNGFKDATTNSDQIRQWWADTPDANIGVATGQISGIWVVDIDGEAGLTSLRQLAAVGHELPHSTAAGTGKGTHHYYRLPAGQQVKSRAAVWPGIDIRADGGYVIAPPSVHPSGARYRWIWPQNGNGNGKAVSGG